MQSTNSLTVQRRFPVYFNFMCIVVDQISDALGYKWLIQVSLYKGGEQTGPAKFTWPNGAVREGSKVGISLCYIVLDVEISIIITITIRQFQVIVPAGERRLGR